MVLCFFNIGYCEDNTDLNFLKNMVTIDTRFDPMTLRQICNEIEKQTGIKALIAKSRLNEYKNYNNISLEDMTLEIRLTNTDVYDAIKHIEERITFKYYSRFDVNRQGNYIIIQEYGPNTDSFCRGNATKDISIKHMPAEQMQKLILDNVKDAKVAVDKRINSVIFIVDKNKNIIRNIIEKNDIGPDKLEDMRLTINTGLKSMTIKQIIELMKKQIGDHIALDREVRISTVEIQVNIINSRLEDAIKIIIQEHNKDKIKAINPLDLGERFRCKYLHNRIEKDVYVFGY